MQSVQLIDNNRDVVAVAEVTDEHGLYSGSINLGAMPPALRAKFEEFEEIVNGQIFSLLDQIEDEINQLGLKVVFNGSPAEAMTDLQIYPRGEVMSFRLKATRATESQAAANGLAVR